MENLRWVARAYDEVLPVCTPAPDKLMKGDRVRITEGQFMGIEATVMTQPGAGQKSVMVCVEDWLWVPLLQVRQGQYEVVSLDGSGKHRYTKLDNDRLFTKMHEAIMRHHSPDGTTDDDRRVAQEIVSQFGRLEMPTPILRCKQYSLLLPAYMVLGKGDDFEAMKVKVNSVLNGIKAEQAAALLLVTMYGCTGDEPCRNKLKRVVDGWKAGGVTKKNKQKVIGYFDDYEGIHIDLS